MHPGSWAWFLHSRRDSHSTPHTHLGSGAHGAATPIHGGRACWGALRGGRGGMRSAVQPLKSSRVTNVRLHARSCGGRDNNAARSDPSSLQRRPGTSRPRRCSQAALAARPGLTDSRVGRERVTLLRVRAEVVSRPPAVRSAPRRPAAVCAMSGGGASALLVHNERGVRAQVRHATRAATVVRHVRLRLRKWSERPGGIVPLSRRRPALG